MKSDSVNLWALLLSFFTDFVLGMLDPLYFYWALKSVCQCVEKPQRFSLGCEVRDQLERMDNLSNIESSNL